MRALLLAAGIGSRLRPLTNTTPKCLVRVHDRPLLDYWLDLVFEGGVERALLNTHWLAEQVQAHVAQSRWRDRIDLVHEDELLGTGGTVLANRAWFADQPFLVAHADNLTDFDVEGLLAAHRNRPSGCIMTMLAFRTDDPSSCGILELDQQNRVLAFHEKVKNPPGNLANGAVYVFEHAVIDDIAALGKSVVDLSTEVIPNYLGRILCVETSGYHRDIGNPESLRRAHLEFNHRPRRGEDA
ncbi:MULTISPECIES: nucleotidyltransferase family protein [Bradyrhizobium]|jgi:mannose-1-phosphate guanylyltransferase|uniref:Nucleotidyltransferase family protein n=3 Tax=Bradyrhizobium TaxID=374 RepID=A0ABS5G723_9BRAD|nr:MULTISPECIES: nucleotidyltransferase family protein [Bradyrhizobium]MBR1137091.1 nucleotidyltransferase family protein [Bradyrhizobium denitrificans]MCL8483251.1 nucleotidyltransferase family protein [Bradyrhizobium denitrificans]MDU0954090.1 nucleotidyltransferase family protein [Bradyrhizobium sp.]MDU1495572.1 nucleotidyltransferase family protein [Bradyrhizobium sp.]MDU1542489.1 nucleotidyltransferase family protein [Bradyrhizobium sp.]